MATVEQPAMIPDVLQSSALHRFSVDDYREMNATDLPSVGARSLQILNSPLRVSRETNLRRRIDYDCRPSI